MAVVRAPLILRRSVQIAQGLESRAQSACCGPRSDELLLSRASRSHASRFMRPYGHPRSDQIPKNNIAACWPTKYITGSSLDNDTGRIAARLLR